MRKDRVGNSMSALYPQAFKAIESLARLRDEAWAGAVDPAGKPAKVLLLQGPVGPFFSHLHKALLAQGVSVHRVAFNPADRLFAGGNGCTRFSGSKVAWETWLHFELFCNRPDTIVLFGSNRPAHRIARRVAALFGVRVLCLEEGYLRSGYITCEDGGNNQSSPMVHWMPRADSRPAGEGPAPIDDSYPAMGIWGALYYLIRDIFSGQMDEVLFHRPRERSWSLACGWVAHGVTRVGTRLAERTALMRLKRASEYILVPLQVPTDSQMGVAARGWTSHRLVDACLAALARTPSGQKLVFKLHPLDRGGMRLKRHILQRAAQQGLEGRVEALHSGRIGELSSHATGMIVINSTSAFSALHHEVPVLVLGEAVFRHESIVTLGDRERDIDNFFKVRRAKQRDEIELFLADLQTTSLIPGDFYLSSGIRIGVAGVVARLNRERASNSSQSKAAECH